MVLLSATKLATDRNSEVGIPELLAGLYIAAFERLQRFWDEWEKMEDFVVSECDLHYPRIWYLLEVREKLQADRDIAVQGCTLDPSAAAIVNKAFEIAASGEVRVEHLLLAIALDDRNDLSRRFVGTGLRIELAREKTQKSR